MGVRDGTRELLPDEEDSLEAKQDNDTDASTAKQEEPKMIKVKEYYVKYKNL